LKKEEVKEIRELLDELALRLNAYIGSIGKKSDDR